MRLLPLLAVLLLTGCVEQAPRYSLGGGEAGVFRSSNAGRPISLATIKGMDERQVLTTFGKPDLDRRAVGHDPGAVASRSPRDRHHQSGIVF